MESNKEAVIAIQGGGVYALSLLGQAKAVIERGYVPAAFAGTSGGAILACLLWSGLTAAEIENEFVEMVKADAAALLNLLSPFEPPPHPHFDYKCFLELQDRIKRMMRQFAIVHADERRGLAELSRLPRAAWSIWGLWRSIRPHIGKRGLFTGHELESTIDRLIRKGFGPQKGMPPVEDPMCFEHVTRMMEASGGDFYRPPLLLTATNLSRRRLEVISSFDPIYSKMPIAAAVRASAGFPIFFRPRPFGDGLNKEWFVDGGMISNFPVWTFSDAFREQIAKSDFYRSLAPRPWVRIGLRVVDDIEAPPDLNDPELFFRALIGMLTGAARNQLEDILSGRAARSVVIRQLTSKTEGPGVLAVGQVDEAKIRRMVKLGYQEVIAELDRTGAPGIYTTDSGLGQLMRDRLRSLTEECDQVVSKAADAKFRANIYIPVRNKLKMVFSMNMDDDSDDNLEFPDLSSGLTGTCYQLRTRLVCNLEKIARLRQTQPTEYKRLFGMTEELQGKVRKDRTWMASVPIFDPYEIKVLHTRREIRVDYPIHLVATHNVGITLGGPVLGVLNVDTAWNYPRLGLDPDPDIHFSDPRIRAILDIMHARALTIGSELTRLFLPV